MQTFYYCSYVKSFFFFQQLLLHFSPPLFKITYQECSLYSMSIFLHPFSFSQVFTLTILPILDRNTGTTTLSSGPFCLCLSWAYCSTGHSASLHFPWYTSFSWIPGQDMVLVLLLFTLPHHFSLYSAFPKFITYECPWSIPWFSFFPLSSSPSCDSLSPVALNAM